jgi:hypothetical protein
MGRHIVSHGGFYAYISQAWAASRPWAARRSRCCPTTC